MWRTRWRRSSSRASNPAFEQVAANADTLADVAELPRPAGDHRRWPDDQWPDWEYLIGIAARARATVTGNEFGGGVDVRDITDSLCDPETEGEDWDTDDPAELAARLPRLYRAALPNLRGGWPRSS